MQPQTKCTKVHACTCAASPLLPTDHQRLISAAGFQAPAVWTALILVDAVMVQAVTGGQVSDSIKITVVGCRNSAFPQKTLMPFATQVADELSIL